MIVTLCFFLVYILCHCSWAGKHAGSQNGRCYCHGCSSHAGGSFQLPASLDDVWSLLDGGVFCNRHADIIRTDLWETSLSHTAEKLKNMVTTFTPSHLVCVRHFARPQLFTSTAKLLFRDLEQI